MTLLNQSVLRFKDWYRALATREKKVLQLGAGIVTVFLVYQLIWSPIIDKVSKLRKQVVHLQKTLLWMQGADKKLSQSPAKAQATSMVQSPVALLSFLQDELNRAGLHDKVTQLKQSTNDMVVLQFSEVNFDRLMGFLIKALNKQSIIIQRMTTEALDRPGMVKVTMMMQVVS